MRSPVAFAVAATGRKLHGPRLPASRMCASSANAANSASGPRSAPNRGVVQQPHVTPVDAQTPSQRRSELRLRQHVNPLASYFQQPVALPLLWPAKVFADPSLPLCVDVGVAHGRWVKAMAAREAGRRNFLGLEIRASLVSAANALRDHDHLRNLHYFYCNANVSFGDIVAPASSGIAGLDLVCFQFCDPWFKSRHAKRRVVQEPIVRQVADALVPKSGRCYVASDVLPLAEEMRARFDACDDMVRDTSVPWTEDGWLVENPFGVRTERESSVLKRKGSVYRALFIRR
jgi:tRNA (guanine-N7-)-methyltransferase